MVHSLCQISHLSLKCVAPVRQKTFLDHGVNEIPACCPAGWHAGNQTRFGGAIIFSLQFSSISLTLSLVTRVNRRIFIAFYPNCGFTRAWQFGARYHHGLTHGCRSKGYEKERNPMTNMTSWVVSLIYKSWRYMQMQNNKLTLWPCMLTIWSRIFITCSSLSAPHFH